MTKMVFINIFAQTMNTTFFIFSQINLNGYGLEWITVLSLLAISLSIFTISSKNPINSVLFLIGLFIVISLYLILFDMTFIAISYLLVYVGAVSILFLFIVMLINIRISELLTEGRNSAVLAVLVVISFGFIFHNKLPYFINLYEDLLNYIYIFSGGALNNPKMELTTGLDINISYTSGVTSKNWDNSLTEVTHISGIGNIFYNVLFINLLVIGLILLVAMVGAIVITVKPKDSSQEPNSMPFAPDYVNISPISKHHDNIN